MSSSRILSHASKWPAMTSGRLYRSGGSWPGDAGDDKANAWIRRGPLLLPSYCPSRPYFCLGKGHSCHTTRKQGELTYWVGGRVPGMNWQRQNQPWRNLCVLFTNRLTLNRHDIAAHACQKNGPQKCPDATIHFSIVSNTIDFRWHESDTKLCCATAFLFQILKLHHD